MNVSSTLTTAQERQRSADLLSIIVVFLLGHRKKINIRDGVRPTVGRYPRKSANVE